MSANGFDDVYCIHSKSDDENSAVPIRQRLACNHRVAEAIFNWGPVNATVTAAASGCTSSMSAFLALLESCAYNH